jgi:hypothetical protein
MRAILRNRRVRWGPRNQSTQADRSCIVDCSQWQVGFSRDRVVPSFLLATDVTEDDRAVSTQRGGVARDRVLGLFVNVVPADRLGGNELRRIVGIAMLSSRAFRAWFGSGLSPTGNWRFAILRSHYDWPQVLSQLGSHYP